MFLIFYIGSGFFDGDMDCECIRTNESLVRCTKLHECVGNSKACKKFVYPKDLAVRVTCLFQGEGYKSTYVCIPCMENWLEESHQVPEEDSNNEFTANT